MSQAIEILAELQRRGVIVAVEGDTLCLKPRRVLDNVLLARVREAKPAILETLRNRPATCSPDCYEVEPGRWIHHSWKGCTTVELVAESSGQQVPVGCWHCSGKITCSCSTCARVGLSESGKCVACKGTGQVLRWVQ